MASSNNVFLQMGNTSDPSNGAFESTNISNTTANPNHVKHLIKQKASIDTMKQNLKKEFQNIDAYFEGMVTREELDRYFERVKVSQKACILTVQTC